MEENQQKLIIERQCEKAISFIDQAKEMLSLKHYDLAANRFYYACFHIIQALFITDNVTAHTHSGMIKSFGQHYIKTGVLPLEYGRFISRLFQLRQRADYNFSYEISEQDVADLYKPAKSLIDDIIALIKTKSQTLKEKCASRIAAFLDLELVGCSQSVYKTIDGRIGFAIKTSKVLSKTRGEKFWFTYSKNRLLKDCECVYHAFCGKDENTLVVLSQERLESETRQMNHSIDAKTGEIRCWHVELWKLFNGRIMWQLQRPKMHEVDITDCLLENFSIR